MYRFRVPKKERLFTPKDLPLGQKKRLSLLPIIPICTVVGDDLDLSRYIMVMV